MISLIIKIFKTLKIAALYIQNPAQTKEKTHFAVYSTSGVMTSRVESDVTSMHAVLLPLVYWPGWPSIQVCACKSPLQNCWPPLSCNISMLSACPLFATPEAIEAVC